MKNMTINAVKSLFDTFACIDDINDDADVRVWIENMQTPQLTRDVALDAFEAKFMQCQRAGWDEVESVMHAFSTMLIATLPCEAGCVNVLNTRQQEFLRRVILGQFLV